LDKGELPFFRVQLQRVTTRTTNENRVLVSDWWLYIYKHTKVKSVEDIALTCSTSGAIWDCEIDPIVPSESKIQNNILKWDIFFTNTETIALSFLPFQLKAALYLSYLK